MHFSVGITKKQCQRQEASPIAMTKAKSHSFLLGTLKVWEKWRASIRAGNVTNIVSLLKLKFTRLKKKSQHIKLPFKTMESLQKKNKL